MPLVSRLAVFCAGCAAVFVPLAAAQPQSGELLPRLHAYVERFQRELPSIVAEEHYVLIVTNTSAQCRCNA